MIAGKTALHDRDRRIALVVVRPHDAIERGAAAFRPTDELQEGFRRERRAVGIDFDHQPAQRRRDLDSRAGKDRRHHSGFAGNAESGGATIARAVAAKERSPDRKNP